ncbi:WcaG Nucleoside-diphosphate-sugar epimerases [Paracoccaceae bacterium]
MRALLVGGGGFIGKHLVAKLQTVFDSIVVVDSFCFPSHTFSTASKEYFQKFSPKKVIVCESDCASTDNYVEYIKACDIIYLMAADTGTGRSFDEPQTCLNENVSKLSIVLTAIRLHNPSCKVVFFSSRAVYGHGVYYCEKCKAECRISRQPAVGRFEPRCVICSDSVRFIPMHESHTLAPISVYGVSKLAGERLVDILLPDNEVVIIRPQNVYGSYQDIHNPYTGLITWFCNAIYREQGVEVYENNFITRDFIHVLDLVEMIFKISICDKWDSRSVFNIGSGTSSTLLDVAHSIALLLNSRSEISVSPKFRVGDVLNATADMSSFNSRYGRHVCASFSDGFQEFLNWYRGLNAH